MNYENGSGFQTGFSGDFHRRVYGRRASKPHYRTTGDDVITASPKVLAQLDERRAKAIFFGDRGFYGQCCAGITAAYIRAALILQRLQKPSRDF